jgi:hypothetical protein
MVRHGRVDPARERDKLHEFLRDVFGVDAAAIRGELVESGFADWTRKRHAELTNHRGPYRFASTPDVDCEALYCLVRAMRPETVVETGVCYGASSSYILQALAANDTGKLYSIDLGNGPGEPPSDYFVPSALRTRWELRIGDSRELLPVLLRDLGGVDLFHHDSLHTYEHMTWEYETAFPWIVRGGILSSHDVKIVLSLRHPLRRDPFSVFCEKRQLRTVTTFNVGFAAMPS